MKANTTGIAIGRSLGSSFLPQNSKNLSQVRLYWSRVDGAKEADHNSFRVVLRLLGRDTAGPLTVALWLMVLIAGTSPSEIVRANQLVYSLDLAHDEQ